MCPIVTTFGPITIYSYGLILAIAVFIAISLMLKEAKVQGYDKELILDLGILLLVVGVVGARFLYVMLNFSFFIKHPKEIIMMHHGGLAILGGIVFSTLAALVFAKRKKLSFLRISDLVIPFVVLAHAIGRIGCFFNGCCYGVPSRFGIYFPVHDAILLPTQLISSVLLLMLYVTLRLLQKRLPISGSIFAAYIILYSILRFLIEFLRFDSPRIFFGLTIFQLICGALFVAGGSFAFYLRWKNKPLS